MWQFLTEVVWPVFLFWVMLFMVIGIPVHFLCKLFENDRKEFWEKENETIAEHEDEGRDARW